MCSTGTNAVSPEGLCRHLGAEASVVGGRRSTLLHVTEDVVSDGEDAATFLAVQAEETTQYLISLPNHIS